MCAELRQERPNRLSHWGVNGPAVDGIGVVVLDLYTDILTHHMAQRAPEPAMASAPPVLRPIGFGFSMQSQTANAPAQGDNGITLGDPRINFPPHQRCDEPPDHDGVSARKAGLDSQPGPAWATISVANNRWRTTMNTVARVTNLGRMSETQYRVELSVELPLEPDALSAETIEFAVLVKRDPGDTMSFAEIAQAGIDRANTILINSPTLTLHDVDQSESL